MPDLPSTKAEARASGAKFYFTGHPCKRGHIANRTAYSGHCTQCQTEHQKAYWAAVGPEYRNALYREWRAENRDRVNAGKRARKWRPKAPRQWHKQNPVASKASAQRYYLRNKDKFAAKVRNRAAMKASAQGKHSAQDIRDLFKAQGGKCVYCRTSLAAKYHVDHIIALSAGGSNDKANLQLLCVTCNLSKGAQHPIEFAQRHGMLL